MRRREPVRDRSVRSSPPAWVTSVLAALVEYRRLGAKTRTGESIPEGFTAWRRQAQDEWCRENGCWRSGTKTCEQVYGRPCEKRGMSRDDQPTGPASPPAGRKGDQ